MTQDSAEIQSVLFGFGHRARHGKDTAAAAVLAARGGNYPGRLCEAGSPVSYEMRSYSFGKQLKDEVNHFFRAFYGDNKTHHDAWMSMFEFIRNDGMHYNKALCIPDWVVYDEKNPMDDPLCPYGKQRFLLQWWGSEYRRTQDENYWVKSLAQTIAQENPEIALITDMRFPNEMKFVEQYGETVKVFRPGMESPNTHISEEALAHVPDEEWSAVIINDGTLADLQRKALETFDRLMDKQQ